ncbi:MAG: Flp family type IVb pilin [Actinomycetota bacterium]|nr:Flp family type IVb pilin [Actinomycetota bacterium]
MKTNLVPLLRYLQELLRGDAGQTMAEYGILIAVIALIVVLAASVLGGSISNLFGSVAGQV